MVTVEEVLEGFKRVFGSVPEVIASAPGRLDFLNTHQDYKGLPVVGVGVNLRCYVAVGRSEGSEAVVASENMKREGLEWIDRFTVPDPPLAPGKWFGNYFRAVVKALKREVGIDVPPFRAYVLSEVPVASGLASSAALEVALTKALSALVGSELSPSEVAEVSYVAEHDVMGIPCGRLDQYSSAFGGVVVIETKPPYRVESVDFREGVFTVADTGVRHSTADIHPRRQAEIEEGLKELMAQDLPEELRSKLGLRYWEPSWASLTEEELEPYLSKVSEVPRKRILYTLRAHRSTLLALKAMEGRVVRADEIIEALGEELGEEVLDKLARAESVSMKRLLLVAAVMNYQHTLLRDLYEVSTPEIETLRETSLKAGALGSKLSGAGLGGAVIALSKDAEVAGEVARACREAGAVSAFTVEYDEGVRLDYLSK